MADEVRKLLDLLSDGAWHFKIDLVADPRLRYSKMRDDLCGYAALKKDLNKLRRFARLQFRERPSGAYRIVSMISTA